MYIETRETGTRLTPPLLHVNVNRDEVNLDLLSGQWERAYLVTSEWESFFALLKTKDAKRVSRMFRANVAPCTAKGIASSRGYGRKKDTSSGGKHILTYYRF